MLKNNPLLRTYRSVRALESDVASLRLQMGRIELHQKKSLNSTDFRDWEFQVFSQWGEDGIIQFLLHQMDGSVEKSFIEFGVETYTEANTRFLLMNDNWRGLVFDGSEKNTSYIRKDAISWRHDLTSVSAFVDRENINGLFAEYGFTGKLGILSIDIDGNDYWVWEAIDSVTPDIVICEYNSLFGSTAAVTIPYDPEFLRGGAHYSNLYYGASLAALQRLGEKKGYSLVAGNSAGNNAFFVRTEKLGKLVSRSVAEVYAESRFREFRNEDGTLAYLTMRQGRQKLLKMPVVDVTNGAHKLLGDLDFGESASH